MRNLLAFFGAAVVVLLGLGYYLGWYTITQQDASPGQTRIQVDIHKDKIGKDVHNTAEKIEEAIDKNKQASPDNSDGKSSSSGNAPAKGSTSNAQPPKSDKVRDDIGNLIIDGWDSGAKK